MGSEFVNSSVSSMSAFFEEMAPILLDNGYFPIPLRGKAPAIKQWNKIKIFPENLLKKFSKHNVGVRTGRLLGVDIDILSTGLSQDIGALAAETLGFTDFIRIGQEPKRALIYQRDKPSHKQTIGKVELLGTGQQLAVFGIHPDTKKPYHWPLENILDCPLTQLPVASEEDLNSFSIEAAKLQKLEPESRSDTNTDANSRNTRLFDYLRTQAPGTGSIDELRKVAMEFNKGFDHPLPIQELKHTVTSVWGYKKDGRLMSRGRQSIVLPFNKNQIIGLGREPRALHLYALLKSTRKSQGPFTIPQQATAQLLGWGKEPLRKAINALVREQHIEIVSRDLRKVGRKQATVYRYSEYSTKNLSC
jgi:hypothetical protein